ncbi:hypothetical protein FCULG_00010737 [Fusarium culmorum]|uniref:Uncharacterized protein n=1 Tax=Fusarium culmorum TaxID=5516 RepID=A0A2T4GYV1_FUSCU|nr:hypothetical protein FCULG_00010737 [Fusarium culmorum]
MKFTTLATTILSITLGADLASAAFAINGDGLKGPIASGKTDTDCKCTLGKDHGSCMLVKSNKKGTNAPNHCLTSIAFAQCQRA